MAATVPTEPVSPAAVYRPLWFEVQRTDPDDSILYEIRPADAADVIALGNGVEEGDIIAKYAALSGDPAIVGAYVLISGAGGYNGEHKVLNSFVVSGDRWFVLDSGDFGILVPSGGLIRLWLHNYTLFCKVLIYTDPTADPVEVILKGQPNLSGLTAFSVDTVIKDYLTTQNLHRFATSVGGGEIIMNAHGLTALFYRVHIAEVYDVPGETDPVDPFDGEHDVLVDDVEDVESYRVAVNAIHPYRNWSTAGMGEYVVGASNFERKFLTEAPRLDVGSFTGPSLTMGGDDRFRVHMLTSSTTVGAADPYEVDYTLRVFEIEPDGSTGSLVLVKNIDLPDITAAFSVAVGPADLALFVSVPDRYVAFISNASEAGLSEPIMITVDRDCKEAYRPFIVLNLLGGVDHFSFTARELDFAQQGEAFYTASTRGLSKDERQWITTNLLKRGEGATLRKPYGPGTGFDYTERAYKGPLVLTRLEDDVVAPVIIESSSALAYSTGPIGKPITIDYRLGVDQYSQRG